MFPSPSQSQRGAWSVCVALEMTGTLLRVVYIRKKMEVTERF